MLKFMDVRECYLHEWTLFPSDRCTEERKTSYFERGKNARIVIVNYAIKIVIILLTMGGILFSFSVHVRNWAFANLQQQMTLFNLLHRSRYCRLYFMELFTKLMRVFRSGQRTLTAAWLTAKLGNMWQLYTFS